MGGRGGGGGAGGGRTAATLTRGGLLQDIKNSAQEGMGRVAGRVQNLALTNKDGTPVAAAQKTGLFDRNYNLQRDPYDRLDDRSKMKVLRTAMTSYHNLYPRTFPSERGAARGLMEGLGFTQQQMGTAGQIGQFEGMRQAYLGRARATRNPVEKRKWFHAALAMQQGGVLSAGSIRLSKGDLAQAQRTGRRVPGEEAR
jgi:hypothetical protein